MPVLPCLGWCSHKSMPVLPCLGWCSHKSMPVLPCLGWRKHKSIPASPVFILSEIAFLMVSRSMVVVVRCCKVAKSFSKAQENAPFFYNRAALQAISFNLWANDLSVRAVCKSYFACNRMRLSAGMFKAASNLSAIVVVSALWPLSISLSDE